MHKQKASDTSVERFFVVKQAVSAMCRKSTSIAYKAECMILQAAFYNSGIVDLCMCFVNLL